MEIREISDPSTELMIGKNLLFLVQSLIGGNQLVLGSSIGESGKFLEGPEQDCLRFNADSKSFTGEKLLTWSLPKIFCPVLNKSTKKAKIKKMCI